MRILAFALALSPQCAAEPEADAVARYLAGLPNGKLEETGVWKAHRAAFDASWKRLAPRIAQMRSFQARELQSPGAPNVFYPFGGPDALTATVLFPDARSYTLVGLEPAGSLPDPAAWEEPEETLKTLRGSLNNLINESFFHTKVMDQTYRGQVTDGLAPTIAIFLVRLDNRIESLRRVKLTASGEVADRQPGERPAGRSGVEFRFRTPRGERKVLRYFSANLANFHWNDNRDLQAFVAAQGKVVTLLKAASYLLHRAEFSGVRNAIFGQSTLIAQDDSGIPYGMFDPALWAVQLYGLYSPPGGIFKNRGQEDLEKAYLAAGSSKPLEFRIGYGANRGKSNLLVARRK